MNDLVQVPKARSCLGVVLLIAAGALAHEAWHLGMTADEPSHLAAAYAWWMGDDVLYPSDTPPLMRIMSGWVPRVMEIPVDRNAESWRGQNAYQIGGEIIGRLEPARAQRFLFAMRLPFIAFPLLIAFLVWRWGGELFGERIGLLLAACAILEPTILGHGALIKSDIAAAFGALWFAYSAWRYWTRPSFRTLAVMTVAMLIATLTKFTLLPLVAIAFVLALIRGPRLAGALLVPATFYVGTLAAYQFRAGPVSGTEEALPPIRNALELLPPGLPWPDQYIRGLIFIGNAAVGPGFTGYMLGHKVTGPAPGYYPLAWAIKFPIPLQVLTLAGVAALFVRIKERKAGAAEAIIFGSGVFYFGSAVLSHFHIGFRHVVTALPFFLLGGGFALARWERRRGVRLAIATGAAWLVVSAILIYPQGISSFNEWIGGPKNGWKYLADSNVDWGQNLPELGRLVEERRLAPIKAYVFGLDAPMRYMKWGNWLPQPWPFSGGAPPERRLRPTPGVYAVSVNILTGLLAPDGYEDYFAHFRDSEPIARAGYSIFVYRVE